MLAPARRADRTPGKPSLDEAAKRLDEQAQRLFERLDKEKTAAPGKSEPPADLSAPAGQVGITRTPMATVPRSETSTPDGKAYTTTSRALSGGAPLQEQSPYRGVTPPAGILTAAALIATAGVILLVRRRRAT